MQAHNETGGLSGLDQGNRSIRALDTRLGWRPLPWPSSAPNSCGTRSAVASWAAVAVNLAVGIGWIVAFTRFLREIDELQRKIMQDALAVTLGVGWVGGFAYVVADAAGLVAHDVDIAVLPALLGVVYMIAIVVGTLRYR